MHSWILKRLKYSRHRVLQWRGFVPSKHGNEVLCSGSVLTMQVPAVEPSRGMVGPYVEQVAGVFMPSPCTPCSVPFPAPVEVIGGRCIMPLVGTVTTAWLLPMLTAEPSIKHLLGVEGARAAPACRVRAVTTLCVEMSEDDASDGGEGDEVAAASDRWRLGVDQGGRSGKNWGNFWMGFASSDTKCSTPWLL